MTERQRAALDAGRNVYSSTNQPARKGRLPSKLKKFCKDNVVSNSDVDKVFKNLIFGKTLDELQELIKPGNKGNLPVIIVLLISAFLQDMEDGTLKEVNTVLDRVFGKATQQVEFTETRKDIPDDPEERKALADTLFNELGIDNADRNLSQGENGSD